MGYSRQPVLWRHTMRCDRCKHVAERQLAEESIRPTEVFDGWRDEGGIAHSLTCSECIAAEVSGCAQEVTGGVWHSFEWGMFNYNRDARMGAYAIMPHTPSPCSHEVIVRAHGAVEAWHDVRPGEEPPEGAKLCKRCYPNGREEGE